MVSSSASAHLHWPGEIGWYITCGWQAQGSRIHIKLSLYSQQIFLIHCTAKAVIWNCISNQRPSSYWPHYTWRVEKVSIHLISGWNKGWIPFFFYRTLKKSVWLKCPLSVVSSIVMAKCGKGGVDFVVKQHTGCWLSLFVLQMAPSWHGGLPW